MARVEVGDQLNVRMVGSENSFGETPDASWRQIATGARLSDYEPLVCVSVSAARLRACFPE